VPKSTVTTTDLEAPGVAKLLAKRILADIDAYCQEEYDDGPRTHLGASLIGRECKRYLWYVFRWCHHPKHDGRLLRLFNRGHREEDRFIEWLEGIGAKIWTNNYSGLHYFAESDSYFIDNNPSEETMNLARSIDETDPDFKLHVGRAKLQGLKFPQFRVSACGGHFGGSLDGIVQLPPEYGVPFPILAEFKTNGTGRAFDSLVASGMPIAKPEHFAQTSTYGSDQNYQFKWCLYMNINKNDDSMHVELVKLDWNHGEQLRLKAESIITSPTPPPRLSPNPTFKTCQYCDMKGICHEGKMVEKNCRSCRYAQPVDNAEWFCHVHKANIPKEYIPSGCPSYDSINKG
jgi:hypothetical protein